MTRRQALLVDLIDAVPAGPGQFHRARRLLKATGVEYVEIISRAGELVGGVATFPHWCRRKPGRGPQRVFASS